MKPIKTCLGLVIALALAHLAAFGIATAQTVETPTAKTEFVHSWQGATAFQGKIADEWHFWLWVSRANLRDYEERGYDPCYTSIVSGYKPVVTRRDDGLWETMFQSSP